MPQTHMELGCGFSVQGDSRKCSLNIQSLFITEIIQGCKIKSIELFSLYGTKKVVSVGGRILNLKILNIKYCYTRIIVIMRKRSTKKVID